MTVLININGELRDAASLDLPKGREFRGAWQFKGPAIEVDMTKAREIQRDRIRLERAAEMLKLDADWFRAAETGDTAAQRAVAEVKQKMRDAPKHPLIEAAQTPEELSGLTLFKLVF